MEISIPMNKLIWECSKLDFIRKSIYIFANEYFIRPAVHIFIFIFDRIKLLTPHSLAVYDVGRRDRGMYQCLVANKESSAQAVAELKLGGKLSNSPNTQFIHIHTPYLKKTNLCTMWIHIFIYVS